MRAVILDDNAVFAEDLKHQIELVCAKRDWPLVCDCYFSSPELLEADLSDTQAAFLDVDMPKISGLEVASRLRQRYPDLILVFVTAFIQYAPDGYKVAAFRYILKSQCQKEIEPCLDAIRNKLLEDQETICLELNDLTAEIPLKNILYFEGTSYRRVLLHTLHPADRQVECCGKLGDYEKKLKDKGFLRIHKSYLVNMRSITRLSNYKARLESGRELKVSETNYKQICSQYLIWKGCHL